MSFQQARSNSIRILADVGFIAIPPLPLLDAPHLRDINEVTERLLCMHAVAAASYRFDKKRALSWLEKENLTAVLTRAEHDFLHENIGRPEDFQKQIESIWALAWSLKIVPELSFWKMCSDRLIEMMPDLRIDEDSSKLRNQAELRSVEDVLKAADLAYCLHWSLRQMVVSNTTLPPSQRVYGLEARRHALGWLIEDTPWEEISLDT